MRSANEEIHDFRWCLTGLPTTEFLEPQRAYKEPGLLDPDPLRNITDGSLYYRAAKMPATTQSWPLSASTG